MQTETQHGNLATIVRAAIQNGHEDGHKEPDKVGEKSESPQVLGENVLVVVDVNGEEVPQKGGEPITLVKTVEQEKHSLEESGVSPKIGEGETPEKGVKGAKNEKEPPL